MESGEGEADLGGALGLIRTPELERCFAVVPTGAHATAKVKSNRRRAIPSRPLQRVLEKEMVRSIVVGNRLKQTDFSRAVRRCCKRPPVLAQQVITWDHKALYPNWFELLRRVRGKFDQSWVCFGGCNEVG